MPYTPPTNITPNQLVTSSQLNTDFLDNIRFLYDRPCVRVVRASDQSISNGSATFIQWNNETYDTANLHDNATNNTRLTTNIGGKWCVFAGWDWEVDVVGERFHGIRVNGGGYRAKTRVMATSLGNPEGTMMDVFHLNAGEYVEFEVLQNSGAALAFKSSEAAHFGMYWLGP